MLSLKDGTVIHNHPPYPDGPAGPFSPADLRFAREYDLAELRAVTIDRTYILRRPDGGFFLDPNEIALEYETRMNRVAANNPGLPIHKQQEIVLDSLSEDGFIIFEMEEYP